jgi:hypothetical protein
MRFSCGTAVLLLLLIGGLVGSAAAMASAPRILSAAPTTNAGDRAQGPSPRITFSPDGDGVNDTVSVLVSAPVGSQVWLAIKPLGGSATAARSATARVGASGVVRLTWDGRLPAPARGRDQSLNVYACTAVQCSDGRVIAHRRMLSIWIDTLRHVLLGDSLQVNISRDSSAPLALQLVSPVTPAEPGVDVAVTSVSSTSALLAIPTTLSPGLWLIRATQGSVVRFAPVVIRGGAQPVPAHTALVVYPTITWRAYDDADCNRDGQTDSWYAHPKTPVVSRSCAFEIELESSGLPDSFDRVVAFEKWFDTAGYAADFTTDAELATMSVAEMAQYPAIVFPSHFEYAPRNLMPALESYRAAGGRLLFLAGNSFYGAVQLGDQTIRRLTYRERTPQRSDFRIAVTGFVVCCWPPEWRVPYRVTATALRKLPWLFSGSGLAVGDTFGVAVREAGHVDAALSPKGTIVVAEGVVPASADVLPVNLKDCNAWVGSRPTPFRPARLDDQTISVAYAKVGRGETFSFGNVGSMQGVMSASILDKAERRAMLQVLNNLFERFLR